MSSCHPALELDVLAGLHWRIRPRALAAVASGNSKEFQAMVRLVETDAEARKFLLPVFYAGLDTQPIGLLLEGLHRSCCFDDDYCINCSESPERRDSRDYYNLLSENLNRVVWCMRAVLLLATFDSFPSLAVPDLWSRIWPWIQFGDTYHDNLPCLKVVAEMDGYYRIFFTAMVLLHRIARRDNSDCVVETPGLPQFVLSMWESALSEPSIFPETGFSELCLHVGAHLVRHFDDAIDGAGGRTGLALLVVKQIDFIYDHSHDAENITGLSSILSALLDKILTDRLLQDALAGQGLVRSLARISSLSSSADQTALFNACVTIIAQCLMTTPGPSLSTEAIGNGILGALLKHASRTSSIPHECKTSFARLNAVHGVFFISMDTFKDAPISGEWMSFCLIANQRFELMKSHLSEQYPALRACDNIECGTIASKSEFRRCSGCLTSHYCSTACQTRDWRHGGHRDSCALTRAGQHLSLTPTPIHYSFQTQVTYKKQILDGCADFWRRCPDDDMLVEIDLSSPGSSSVSFSAADTLADEWPPWTDYMARAASSGGRLQFHVLRVAFGSKTQAWVFPLRSATSEISNGVRQIAVELRNVEGEDAEEYRERIQRLVELEVVETHTTGFLISSS
ncbi:MYND-type domain-containing protein [Mycena venus]|uniref:MYND-type domain-containing protein n=1 Tax=Mycena venus TaxID=2733690 RepID=A0A8H6XT69_9AGAR|nr:MYND-type domain-containing protein [Mycena venus]